MLKESTIGVVAFYTVIAASFVGTGCTTSDHAGPGGKDAGDASTGPDGAMHPEAGTDAEGPRPKGTPPEVTAAAKEWPMANRDYSATRATFDATIDSTNVRKLKEVWRFQLPSGFLFGSATAAPIVLNGVVYYQDTESDVYALDLATGQQKWAAMYMGPTPGPNGGAVGWGKLFAATSANSVAALDLQTGTSIWSTTLPLPKAAGIDIQPVAYDGLVYVSSVPVSATSEYNGNVAGVLYALDERNGDIVWKFDTVDSADIWGNETLNSGGGAWYTPTIDVATGIMYWGTGNAAPIPGVAGYPNGSSRPGPNLYTSSVLALGAGDGKLSWYYQDEAHNLSDADFQSPPLLVSAMISGSMKQLAIGSGKTGSVAALDRATGKRIWRTLVGKHQNDDGKSIPDAGLVVFPGDLGGVETPPAYADGVMYVPVVNAGSSFTPTTYTPSFSGTGQLVALDVTTGDVIWQTPLPSINLGAATVTNDLVMTSSFDGAVFAFDRATGKELFRYLAPGAVNAPLCVSGNTVLVPEGDVSFAPTAVSQQAPYLVALQPLATQPAPIPDGSTLLPPDSGSSHHDAGSNDAGAADASKDH